MVVGQKAGSDFSDNEDVDFDHEDDACSNDSSTGLTGKDRKRRRGVRKYIIEKRRRDRINNSLSELKRLVPTAFEKQGSAKLEKAEILQMTVDHLKSLVRSGLGVPNSNPLEFQLMGFRECAKEVNEYLTSEGIDSNDPLRLRLMSHLACCQSQRSTGFAPIAPGSVQPAAPQTLAMAAATPPPGTAFIPNSPPQRLIAQPQQIAASQNNGFPNPTAVQYYSIPAPGTLQTSSLHAAAPSPVSAGQPSVSRHHSPPQHQKTQISTPSVVKLEAPGGVTDPNSGQFYAYQPFDYHNNNIVSTASSTAAAHQTITTSVQSNGTTLNANTPVHPPSTIGVMHPQSTIGIQNSGHFEQVYSFKQELLEFPPPPGPGPTPVGNAGAVESTPSPDYFSQQAATLTPVERCW